MNKIESLRFSIQYINDRIGKIDNKANILIAVQTGTLTAVTWVIEKIFISNNLYVGESHLAIGINAIISTLVVCILLQTVRPTNWFLGFRVKKKSNDFEQKLNWFNAETNKKASDFKKSLSSFIENMNEESLTNEYTNTLCKLQLLASKKI